MKERAKRKWKAGCHSFLFSVLTGLSVSLAGCVAEPYVYGPPPYPAFHPFYYDYYFYPTAHVYFQFTTGYYFYLLDGRWVKSRVLPPSIHLGVADRVKLKIDSDKPYTNYNEHIRLYKPKPDYHIDEQRSLKEREANKTWFQQYEQRQPKPVRRPPKDKKDRNKDDRR